MPEDETGDNRTLERWPIQHNSKWMAAAWFLLFAVLGTAVFSTIIGWSGLL